MDGSIGRGYRLGGGIYACIIHPPIQPPIHPPIPCQQPHPPHRNARTYTRTVGQPADLRGQVRPLQRAPHGRVVVLSVRRSVHWCGVVWCGGVGESVIQKHQPPNPRTPLSYACMYPVEGVERLKRQKNTSHTHLHAPTNTHKTPPPPPLNHSTTSLSYAYMYVPGRRGRG